MKRYGCLVFGGIVLVWSAGGAWAQPEAAATEPAPGPEAKPQPMLVTVKAVEGVAHYLEADKAKEWQPLKVGDKLSELTLIRTGFGTRVVLAFADNSEVVIDRATKAGIAEFRKVGKVTRTRVGLKYGSVRMNVSRARGPNDFSVSTPVATAAVAGSFGETGFGDFGWMMEVGGGGFDMNMGNKHRFCGAGDSTDGNLSSSSQMKKKRHSVLLGDVFGGMGWTEMNSQMYFGGGQGGTGQGGAGEGSNRMNMTTTTIRRVNIDVPGLDIIIGG